MTIREKTDKSIRLVLTLGGLVTPLLFILAVIAGFWSITLFNIIIFVLLCEAVGAVIYLAQGIKCPACNMRLGQLLWTVALGTQTPLRSCPYCKTSFETELPIKKGQQGGLPNANTRR